MWEETGGKEQVNLGMFVSWEKEKKWIHNVGVHITNLS